MARPRISDRPMTPAERMRRHRQARREGTSLAPARAARRGAEASGRSERWHYYARTVERHGVPELVALLEPPHRLGILTAARIVLSLDPMGQRLVADAIRAQGKTRGFAMWDRCVSTGIGTWF